MSESQPRWQPVLLLSEKRVECNCGALAVVASLDYQEEDEPEHTKTWCQSCFAKLNDENENEEHVRTQPVLLIIDKRLECQCGALATVVSGKVDEDHYNVLDDVDVWCQSCFEQAKRGQGIE